MAEMLHCVADSSGGQIQCISPEVLGLSKMLRESIECFQIPLSKPRKIHTSYRMLYLHKAKSQEEQNHGASSLAYFLH